MASRPKITPPFAWLGRYRVAAGLVTLIATAAYFRFAEITILPPGLDETSARIGLQALNLDWSKWYPPLDATSGFSPLWIWLQALAVKLFGHTAWALRLWPALLGTAAVAAVWLLARRWFSLRVAWVAGLLMAVSPWAVTASRNGLPSALPPLLVPLTLWLATRAKMAPTYTNCALLGLVLALNLLAGPLGWLTVVLVIGFGLWRLVREKSLLAWSRARLAGLGVLAVGGAVMAFIVASTLPAVSKLAEVFALTLNPATLGTNAVKVLLMLNVHGDENYRHNLSGEPMLNAFVGLMLIAGLLISLARSASRVYRTLVIAAAVLLLPAVFTTSGVPNSSYAIAAMPLLFVLAGVGTSYMLELWFATFPINSAARATGQLAILMLLGLSFLQGYTQYFRAWAGSTAVYLAYNEGPTEIANRLDRDPFNGERYIVGSPDQLTVVHYLAHDVSSYRRLSPAELQALPIAPASRQFYITATSRDEMVKILKAKFPGGVLRPHYSDFNQVEIYYTYEVKQ